MIFIYEYMIFGGVLAVACVAYILSLQYHLRLDEENRLRMTREYQTNAASSSLSDSLLSSAVEV